MWVAALLWHFVCLVGQNVAACVHQNTSQRWFGTLLLVRLPEIMEGSHYVDKTGILPSYSGHHDDSSLWSTSRWRTLDCFSQTTASRRWWQTLFSAVLYPRPSLLAPSLSPRPSQSARLPPCTGIKPEPKKMQISICFHGYQRGLLQRLLQSLFTLTIVLRDKGSQTHTPLVLPPTTHYSTL